MFLMIHPINYLFIHPWCIPLNATLLLLTTFRSVISRLIPHLGFWFRRMFTQLKFCLFYFGGQINVIVRLEICPHFSVQVLLWGFGSQLPNCIAFRSYEETLPKRQPGMWWEKKNLLVSWIRRDAIQQPALKSWMRFCSANTWTTTKRVFPELAPPMWQ